jgi:WD40 repeat protein
MRFLATRVRVVDQVAFADAGRRLVAAGTNIPVLRYRPDNRGIEVWDTPGGDAPVGRLFPDSVIAGFAVNPAGRWLYAGTGYDRDEIEESHYFAVDLADGEPVRMGLRGGNALTLRVHNSGEWLVGFGYLSTWQSKRLVRWRQPADGPPVKDWEWRPPSAREYAAHVACDPDGSRIVTQDRESGKMVVDQVYEFAVRDPASGKVREKIPLPGRKVEQLLVSPDGAWLVIRAGPSLLVWNARDLRAKPRKVKGNIRGHFTDLAFHPSGKYLAATSNDATVKLFDTAMWEPAKTFTWDVGKMRSIAFSPDGTLAAAGSDSGKVVVWDVDV